MVIGYVSPIGKRPGALAPGVGRHPLKSMLLAGLLLGAITSANAGLITTAEAGLGYASWELCTRTLVSGDSFVRVRDQYAAPIVEPLPWIWTIDFDTLGGWGAPDAPAQFTVSTLLGPWQGQGERTTVYRPGLGCTQATPDTTVQNVLSQPFVPASLPPLSRTQPWPLGDGAPETRGLTLQQRSLLKREGDGLFKEYPPSRWVSPKNTIAVLVARDGKLIYERYAKGYNRNQPQLGWSMTKSLTALIAGALVTDHRLDLDAPVLERFKGTDKADITWRPVLNMAPGLQWYENYNNAGDVGTMLFFEADEAGYAAAKPVVAPPQTVFNYSTGTANIAGLGLREILGSPQALYDYTQHRLFEPLGIREGLIEQDASGTISAGSRGVLKPRDWLRLGQLVLNDGTWQGQTLIDRSFIEFMKAPSPASDLYGGFLWLYDPSSMPHNIPHDVVILWGHLGQLVVVVPSKNLVVARLGVSVSENLVDYQVFEAVADLANGL